MSEGKPTDRVRNGGVEGREGAADEILTMPPAAPTAESFGAADSPSAESPPLWLASHSGWKKWSRWSIRAPLRTVYQEGAKQRRGLVSDFLERGEEVLSDGPAYRVAAPREDESAEPSGHLLVATKQLMYAPEHGVVVALRYAQLQSVTFAKQKSGWVAMELITDTQDTWDIVVLPRTVRVARKVLKKENPAALR
jgi:hypothetical protein